MFGPKLISMSLLPSEIAYHHPKIPFPKMKHEHKALKQQISVVTTTVGS